MPSHQTPTSRTLLDTALAWARGHRLLVDGFWMVFWSPLTFLATYAAAIGTITVGTSSTPFHHLLSLALATGFTAPMLWRRTRPDVATAVVVATHLLQLVATHEASPGNITVPIFLHAVARHGDRRLARFWLGVGALGSLAAGVRWGLAWNNMSGRPVETVMAVITLTLGCLAVVVAAWALGQWGYQRQETLRSLQDRADALEREHAQGVRLVVEEERTRIAREMHDVVAHSLSVIVVQSDGAKYLATHDELGDTEARLAQVGRAIETINATARGALLETRRMVGVLRADDETAELAPAASLAQVEGLVAQLREAGVPANLHVSGDPRSHADLGTGAELAAYRVVQESLTNALKHAGRGARVEVALHHSPAGLDVRVRDDGVGATPTDGRGHGLVGMRERVAAWGGTLTAGPHPVAGWEVAAHIPATPKETR